MSALHQVRMEDIPQARPASRVSDWDETPTAIRIDRRFRELRAVVAGLLALLALSSAVLIGLLCRP